MTNEIERIALFPLRVGLDVTRLVWRPVIGLVERALGHAHANGHEAATAATAATAERPAASAPFPAAEPAFEPAPPAYEPEPPEPEHVESEEVLVARSADAGAEDAPGPQIDVAEPWAGYRRMKADEILARIETSAREELAVIQLYEGMHRRRKTVLAAAERRLKAVSPPAAG